MLNPLLLLLSLANAQLGYDDINLEFKRGKCRSCHPAIWREWSGSMHAKAWTDPIYQAAANQIADRENSCDPCHAPEPILITGIGEFPKLRSDGRESGVTCLVCHVDADGAMHGPPASADALFHANVTDEAHTKPTKLCATCHGQPSVPEHNQLESFKGSLADKSGKSCAHCHMPRVTRLQSIRSYEAISGRRHTWDGSRSVAMLKRAADLEVKVTGGIAYVSIRNKAGHKLPGEALRTLTLQVSISAADEERMRQEQVTISAASGDDGGDNRLAADETRTFQFPLNGGRRVHAALLYRLTPTTPESESITMAESTHPQPVDTLQSTDQRNE